MGHQVCGAPGFSVNGSQWATTYIGGANIIGTNQSSWASCFTCGKAPGFCTQVPGSNLTNQFSQWQGALLEHVPAPARELVQARCAEQQYHAQLNRDKPFALMGMLLVTPISWTGNPKTAHTGLGSATLCAGYDATPALLTSALSAKNCSWLYNQNVTCGPLCSQIGRYFACQWGQQAAQFSMNGDLSFVISLNSRCACTCMRTLHQAVGHTSLHDVMLPKPNQVAHAHWLCRQGCRFAHPSQLNWLCMCASEQSGTKQLAARAKRTGAHDAPNRRHAALANKSQHGSCAHSLLSLTSGGVANASSFYPNIASFNWPPGSQTGAMNVILYNSGNITVRAACQGSSRGGGLRALCGQGACIRGSDSIQSRQIRVQDHVLHSISIILVHAEQYASASVSHAAVAAFIMQKASGPMEISCSCCRHERADLGACG